MIEYDELIWLLIVVLIGSLFIYQFGNTIKLYIDWLWDFIGLKNKVLRRLLLLASFIMAGFWLVEKWEIIGRLITSWGLEGLSMEGWMFIFLFFCACGILVLGGIYLISIIIKWIIDRYNKG